MEKSSSPSYFQKIDSDEFEKKYDSKKIARGISRQSIPILCIILFFAAIAGGYTYRISKRTMAEAFLVFEPLETKELPGGIPFSAPTLETAIEMIRIPANFSAVKSRLDLKGSIQEVAGKFDFPPPKNQSNVVKIVAYGDNAQTLVNTLADIATKANSRYFQNQFDKSLLAFLNQMEYAQDLLNKKLSEIEEFKKKEHYYDVDARNSLFLVQLEALKKQVKTVDLQTEQVTIEYEHLKKELERYSTADETSSGPQAPSNLEELERTLFEARLRYAKENPKLKNLEREYASLKEKSEKSTPETEGDKADPSLSLTRKSKDSLRLKLLTLKSQLLAYTEQQKKLHQEEAKMNTMALDLPRLQIQFSKVLEEKKLIEDQLTYLNNSVDHIRILLATQKGNLSILQLSEKENDGKKSQWIFVLPFAGPIFGLLFGVAFAFLHEVWDPRIRTAKELHLRYTLPCFTVIPHLKKRELYDLEKETLSSMRELYDHVNLSIEKQQLKGKPISIAFLSTRPHNGCALVSYSYGLYLKKLQKKVLYISFWPTSFFPLKKASQQKPGLEEVLEGEVDFQEAVCKETEIDTLILKTHKKHLTEILEPDKGDKFLSLLKRSYDVIVIRPPPVYEDPASLKFATVSDLTLFLISSSKDKKEDIDHALALLQNRNPHLIGFILNDVPTAYYRDTHS